MAIATNALTSPARPMKNDINTSPRKEPMRLHDESLDQDLDHETGYPVFQGPTDAVAALDVSVTPVNASVDGQGGTIRDKPVFTIEQVIAQLNRGDAAWTLATPPTPRRATATSAC